MFYLLFLGGKMAIKSVGDKDFKQQVIESEGCVLVDFWAEWCGPCRALAPKLEEIDVEMGSRITVFKVNIDENPETPTKYGVKGIPTMVLFKDGIEVEQLVGNQSKEDIVKLVGKHT